jgi:hypothetical protein
LEQIPTAILCVPRVKRLVYISHKVDHIFERLELLGVRG